MNTTNPLLTDLYQLTMVAAYHASGRAEQEAAFHLFFRTLPFKGGYAIAAGLGSAVEWLENFRFAADDIVYLATLRDSEKAPLLQPAFLDYLLNLKLPVSIDAIPEGTLVFPHQPLLRITGPILQCQLLETALLDIINFQTLSATKAARVCQAAQGEPVLEMGLRRGQGADGAVSASRAAHIGGCATTSNVLAGKTFGIPVKGTHAHSWVMSFESELEAFEQYAAALPGNCIFLVGTYDTLEGVRNAVKMGIKLRESGHRLLGIRLDSGDRAWLSQQARIILDEGGFPDAAIVASNDLDVNLIESLKHQGAKINVWASAPNSSPAATKPRSAVSINSPPSATLRETGSRASNSASRSSKFPRPVSNRSAGSRRTGNSSRTPLTMLSWIALNHATMDGDTSGSLAVINQQQPTAELRPAGSAQIDDGDLMPYPVLDVIERAAIRDKRGPADVFIIIQREFPEYPATQLFQWLTRCFQLWSRNQWKRERYAPSFHLGDPNLDPKTGCRWPILSGGFALELEQLKRQINV